VNFLKSILLQLCNYLMLNLFGPYTLRLNSSSFQLVNGILFRQNFDGVLMRCLEKDEAEKVLLELHAGEAGGHFGGDTTAHKILRAGYY
jgi:hypothetical protein